MTDGMKSGSGSDPFADEPTDDTVSDTPESSDLDQTTATGDTNPEQEPNAHDRSEPSNSSTTSREDALPYIFARHGVKQDRKMVQYFLRDETEALEAEVNRAVEEELGTDVFLTDIREALVRVGANHVDEVADELREWGYRFEEDSN